MASFKESIITVAIILLGVIIIPVLFIWSTGNVLALTMKTFLGAFFALLVVGSISRRSNEPHHQNTKMSDEEE